MKVNVKYMSGECLKKKNRKKLNCNTAVTNSQGDLKTSIKNVQIN